MKHARVLYVCGTLTVLVMFLAGPSLLARAPRPTDESKSAGKQSQSQSYVPPADASLYVGSDVCQTCHEDQAKSYEKNRHFITTLSKKTGPQWEGCEACHGPGKAHVDGGGDKTKIYAFHDTNAAQMSQRCLACHAQQDEQINYLRSAHSRSGVGCLDCHSIHKPEGEEHLLKTQQSTLCFKCHVSVKPDFSRPFHHKVNEGLIQCSDCHNPHGGFDLRQIRSAPTRDAVCYNCHADKAGPFAVEHAVMRTEGCTACHSPHGSPNPQLLKRSQINLLCLECHTTTAGSAAPGIPSFHNQAQKYQACTLCHIAIHGSNSDPTLLRP